MYSLLLNIGHNSSAMALVNGKLLGAYEQERLSRIKSDSAFPQLAIEKLLKLSEPDPECDNTIFVSHWYDDWGFHQKRGYDRHYDYDYIELLREKYNFKLVTLSPTMTHHHAHAYSALSFIKRHARPDEATGEWNVLVADGFGNNQEVLTIFRTDDMCGAGDLEVVRKVYGYKYSLGLLYQYAVRYCSMREHQDEYKFLGYEAQVMSQFTEGDVRRVDEVVEGYVDDYSDMLGSSARSSTPPESTRGMVVELDGAREHFYSFYNEVVSVVEGEMTLYRKRVIVGYAIQSVIEKIHGAIARMFDMKNVAVSGGLYFNVKLNNAILNTISGYFSAAPLAGDQGAAIGLYERYVGSFPYVSLLWGPREPHAAGLDVSDNIDIVRTKEELTDCILTYLREDSIVNVVSGPMEYGPRALCNTSTLALPTSSNVDFINAINGRDTIMPMAPVMLASDAGRFFSDEESSRVIGSDAYMILTYNYHDDMSDMRRARYSGVMHDYPCEPEKFSGRPQLVKDGDHYINDVLGELRGNGIHALINTSFNIHGEPILYSVDSAVESFKSQVKRAQESGVDQDRIKLVMQL